MAASIELKRVATEAEAAVSGLQSALDRAERVLEYYVSMGLSTELAGLATNEIISGNIDKDRTQLAGVLLASIAFYLRAMEGATTGQTVLDTTPLTAAELKEHMDKLGI